MARVSPLNSDNESTNGATSSAKGKVNQKASKSENSMDVDGGSEEEDGDEEESEYEIEAIIDAKRGSFPEGRMGYLVKWKGYDDTENSWVDEKDAGNAENLIAEYWKTHPKTKKVPRIKEPKSAAKRPRKSAAPDDDSERETPSTTKKRGRKSLAKADSDIENGKEENESRAKKSRKSASSKPSKETPQPSADASDIGTMKQYMSLTSWESLVESVDTIEREEDGTLVVYFALKSGERVRETSEICGERFPQRLLKFYESNLRWRTAESSETGDV